MSYGQLREPFIEPNADEREGYVPNVVYTCSSPSCSRLCSRASRRYERYRTELAWVAE